ncbi:DNA-binding domain-containing protein [Psychrilyobacter sp.]|uniref:DNA-binding domain-containing protein n=1 Tax=Psychrilyobacter sp. TaxID=2586924 RepID=UPI003015EA03
MKIFIVDDDPSIIRILKDIIMNNKLGKIVGSFLDGAMALEKIRLYCPDIVLVDYLMPGMDGATLVKNILKDNPNISRIMVSQVSNSQMVTQTYMAGIEFFIHKPINIIEVINIIKSVTEKINLKKQISMVQDIFQTSYKEKNSPIFNYTEQIQLTLSNLGILGEKGEYDILDVCSECIKINNSEPWEVLSKFLNSKSKVLKQRIRRALTVGLKTISHVGIEDNLNEVFIKYSNTLFDFQEVHLEMEKLRGHSPTGGKISSTKFFENLLVQCRKN